MVTTNDTRSRICNGIPDVKAKKDVELTSRGRVWQKCLQAPNGVGCRKDFTQCCLAL